MGKYCLSRGERTAEVERRRQNMTFSNTEWDMSYGGLDFGLTDQGQKSFILWIKSSVGLDQHSFIAIKGMILIYVSGDFGPLYLLGI